uniref:Uncharacterized protein n=1 Tax=Anguilla anguilla TaxID=7936 RepID=A0A0E9SK70_ANGAN
MPLHYHPSFSLLICMGSTWVGFEKKDGMEEGRRMQGLKTGRLILVTSVFKASMA